MKTSPFILSLAALAGALSMNAAGGPLAVGDPAPKLQVGKWMLGEPVKKFARDKAYIVEFWAPWCRPCVGAIVLQEKAVLAEEDEGHKKQLKATLDSYKEGKLPKAELGIPWSPDGG